MKTVFCLTIIVIVFVPAAAAQDGDVLRVTDRDLPEAETLRGNLFVSMETVRLQMDLTEEALEVLLSQGKGDAETSLRANMILLVLEKDRADLLATTAPAVEELRWSLHVDRERKLDLAEDAVTEAEDANAEIVDAGAALREAQAEMERHPEDTPERWDAEERFHQVQEEMRELIRFRNDLEEDATRFREQAEDYEDELRMLDTLEKRLQGVARRGAVRVRRIAQAMKKDSAGVVSREIRKDRDTIRAAMDLLSNQRTRTEVFTAEDNPEETEGVPYRLERRGKPELLPEIAEELERLEAKRRAAEKSDVSTVEKGR